MTNKRNSIYCAIALATSFACAHVAMAEEVDPQTPPEATEQPAEVESGVVAETEATENTAAGNSAASSMDEPAAVAAGTEAAEVPVTQAERAMQREERLNKRWEERDRRYQKLRKEAEAVGLEMPETPPWSEPAETAAAEQEDDQDYRQWRQQQQQMRERRFEMVRQRAEAMGIELPDFKPWEDRQKWREEMRARTMERRERLRAVFDEMTDDQKQACEMYCGKGRASARGYQFVAPVPGGYDRGSAWQYQYSSNPYEVPVPPHSINPE